MIVSDSRSRYISEHLEKNTAQNHRDVIFMCGIVYIFCNHCWFVCAEKYIQSAFHMRRGEQYRSLASLEKPIWGLQQSCFRLCQGGYLYICYLANIFCWPLRSFFLRRAAALAKFCMTRRKSLQKPKSPWVPSQQSILRFLNGFNCWHFKALRVHDVAHTISSVEISTFSTFNVTLILCDVIKRADHCCLFACQTWNEKMQSKLTKANWPWTFVNRTFIARLIISGAFFQSKGTCVKPIKRRHGVNTFLSQSPSATSSYHYLLYSSNAENIVASPSEVIHMSICGPGMSDLSPVRSHSDNRRRSRLGHLSLRWSQLLMPIQSGDLIVSMAIICSISYLLSFFPLWCCLLWAWTYRLVSCLLKSDPMMHCTNRIQVAILYAF